MKYCTDDGKHIFDTEEELFDFERKNAGKPNLECIERNTIVQTDIWFRPKYDKCDCITDFELLNFDSIICPAVGDWNDVIYLYQPDSIYNNTRAFDRLTYSDNQLVVYINDQFANIPTYAKKYEEGAIHIRLIRKL